MKKRDVSINQVALKKVFKGTHKKVTAFIQDARQKQLAHVDKAVEFALKTYELLCLTSECQ